MKMREQNLRYRKPKDLLKKTIKKSIVDGMIDGNKKSPRHNCNKKEQLINAKRILQKIMKYYHKPTGGTNNEAENDANQASLLSAAKL